MQMRSAAASVLGSTVARALKVRSPIRTDRRQNRKGKRCMMMGEGGDCSPVIVSERQSGNEAVTLADLVCPDKPPITLAVGGACGA